MGGEEGAADAVADCEGYGAFGVVLAYNVLGEGFDDFGGGLVEVEFVDAFFEFGWRWGVGFVLC
jgi:hypothetical protein